MAQNFTFAFYLMQIASFDWSDILSFQFFCYCFASKCGNFGPLYFWKIWKDIQAFLINILSFANLQIFHPFLFVFCVGAATGGPTSHLGLGGHHNPTPHPALSTPHQFGSSVTSNGGPGSTGEREPVVDDKKHLSGRHFLLFSCHFGYFLALFDDFWLLASGRGQKTFLR